MNSKLASVRLDENKMYLNIKGKLLDIPWEEIDNISYYCGKSVQNIPMSVHGRLVKAEYARSYNLLIKTKKKYY